jgi:23S rRNA (cytidine1920-2'-O)/16S rRNA (cytidine1409-2'-O)-methyltransferase
MGKKQRLDVLLTEQNIFASREKAKAAIMAGLVFVDGVRCDKPGTKVDSEAAITVKGNMHPYVSRGGLKLEKAIAAFSLDLRDKVVMDIGASTGGFTDCALLNGARKVYAIDVGYGQLDWKLRNDPRVIVMEKTNFRYLKPEDLPGELPDLATIDVSFISLTIILRALKPFLTETGEAVCLVKPQFEAGKEAVGKNGIVKDAKVHREVLEKTIGFACSLGYSFRGLTYSPILGGEGNIEFLLYLHASANGNTQFAPVIYDVVSEAHEQFANKKEEDQP